MLYGKEKTKTGLLIGIIVVIILGTLTALMNTVDSESEIIGGGDEPTDIWVGDE